MLAFSGNRNAANEPPVLINELEHNRFYHKLCCRSYSVTNVVQYKSYDFKCNNTLAQTPNVIDTSVSTMCFRIEIMVI